jgi:tripartite ATP-independent transporter DctM subunit
VSANSDVTVDPANIAFAGAVSASAEEPLGRATHVSDPVEQLAEIIVVVALAGELVAMFGNVISRSLFDTSLLWSLEIGELALVVMTFVGGAIAYPRGEHMALHVLVERLPRRWHAAIDALGSWQVLAMALVGGWLAWQMMLSRWDERTPYLGLRAIWFAVPMIFGMALLAYFAVKRALRQPRRTAWMTGVTLAFTLAVLLIGASMLGPQARDYALPAAFVVFTVQLLLGVPIGFVLLMATLLYLHTSHTVPLSVVPINMQSGISSFVMLSIPFFILAGYVMTEGGLSRRLTDFVISLVGRFRGGMLQVIVVSMYIMSGISGSKIADVAAVGTTMKDIMRRERYNSGETAAVLATCAVMGETVPPSIAMLVLASVTSLSIGSLFVAGLLPAAVIALCLMVLIYFRSRDRAGQSKKHSLREIFRAGVDAVPAVVAPIILIGGIVSGIATPTEVSSTAVIYALLLSIFVYRTLGGRQLWRVMTGTAAQAGMVLFITSTASTFSWSLTIAKMPQKIAALFTALHGSATLFMLATIVTLVVMGALLEGLPALLIFGPLLLPMVGQFGIDPLQYGVVMIISMGLGAFSPPIGVGMFVTCSICDTTMENASRHMVPYLLVVVIGLLLVAFIPWFSLIAPRLLHMI